MKKIVALTNLKQLPETCGECPYKYYAAETECYFTQKGVPLKFENQKKNSNCPLREIEVR